MAFLFWGSSCWHGNGRHEFKRGPLNDSYCVGGFSRRDNTFCWRRIGFGWGFLLGRSRGKESLHRSLCPFLVTMFVKAYSLRSEPHPSKLSKHRHLSAVLETSPNREINMVCAFYCPALHVFSSSSSSSVFTLWSTVVLSGRKKST